MSSYQVPATGTEARIREKKSRFLAVIEPISDRTQAQRLVDGLKRRHHDATHHCWAWRLGAVPPAERSFDDGEPAGTAGRPILQVLRGGEISDVLAVVVRWYGGVKLGRGGLARAYTLACQEALAQLSVKQRYPTCDLELAVPYERLAALQSLIHPPQVLLHGEEYGEQVRLCLRVQEGKRRQLEEQIRQLGLTQWCWCARRDSNP